MNRGILAILGTPVPDGESKKWGRKTFALYFSVLLFADFCVIIFPSTQGDFHCGARREIALSWRPGIWSWLPRVLG